MCTITMIACTCRKTLSMTSTYVSCLFRVTGDLLVSNTIFILCVETLLASVKGLYKFYVPCVIKGFTVLDGRKNLL